MRHGPEYAIPGLDIEPPSSISRGDKIDEAERGEQSSREGIGGWISNMVNRGKNAKNRGEQGRYRQLDQDGED